MFIEIIKFIGWTAGLSTAFLALNVAFPALVGKYTKNVKWRYVSTILAGLISLSVLGYFVVSTGVDVKSALANKPTTEDFIYENQCRIIERIPYDRRVPGGPVYHYVCSGMDFWR